jgi:hypothetical protein
MLAFLAILFRPMLITVMLVSDKIWRRSGVEQAYNSGQEVGNSIDVIPVTHGDFFRSISIVRNYGKVFYFHACLILTFKELG